jgi:hypothetical protein
MTGPWNVSVCKWNIGCRIKARRYVTDTILVKSTEIARFVSQILRTCQRAFAPIAIQRPASDQRNRCISGSRRGHSPYPKVVWRNLTATAPRSSCSSRFMALANHSLLQRCLKFSADPRSGIALRKTADSHHCRCRRCRQFRRCPEGFDSFSDKFVRGLQPPESIQNRAACRSPTGATPSPHDIAASSPNSSPHSQFPPPRLRGLTPRPGAK